MVNIGKGFSLEAKVCEYKKGISQIEKENYNLKNSSHVTH
jgi:hypothetical protein